MTEVVQRGLKAKRRFYRGFQGDRTWEGMESGSKGVQAVDDESRMELSGIDKEFGKRGDEAREERGKERGGYVAGERSEGGKCGGTDSGRGVGGGGVGEGVKEMGCRELKRAGGRGGGLAGRRGEGY